MSVQRAWRPFFEDDPQRQRFARNALAEIRARPGFVLPDMD